jgi:UDP-N-acetylglucosamine--N-acetylmuramyl-(pentapeptide) pyrophosphoryl-undecaprenol N-acetylglucosamine transferase
MAAARVLDIPIFLIEPNVYPGLANRLASRAADAIAVAYQETADWFGSKARVTGVPVRHQFLELSTAPPGRGPLKVLVFGGSRGSHPINRLVQDALPHLPAGSVTFVHQTGYDDHQTLLESHAESGLESEVLPYLEDMPTRFRWADLLVCRSGASTIAEITAAGKPAILVPFPQAADDHQRRNALALASRNAALLLEQSTASGETLSRNILALAQDRERLSRMAAACKQLAKPKATEEIVDYMEELID